MEFPHAKRLAKACVFAVLALAFCSTSFAFQKCSFPNGVTVNPSLINIPSSGGASSFGVSAVPTCTWTAQSNLSFVHITAITDPNGGPGGIGSGIVKFSVDANPDLAPRGDSNFAVKVIPADGNNGFGGIIQAAASGDFSLSASPASQTVSQGASGSFAISVQRSGGFTGSVSFLAPSGLPSGATAAYSNFTVDGATLTISVSATTAGGNFPITITGRNGNVSHTTQVTLMVPDFSVGLSPSALTVVQGASTSGQVIINRINGFSGCVGFGPSNVPGGVGFSFSPNPACGASSTMTVNANGFGMLGSFPVTITGTNQSLSRATSLTVTVAGFTLSACDHLTVFPGGNGSCTITLNPSGGYTGSAQLSASGLPSGVTATFSPNPTSSSSTMTLVANGSAVPGTYPLTINGVDGNQVTKAVNVNLILGTPPVASRYVPVTPCRLVDTRNPPGTFAGPILAGNTTREFDVPNGACNIPSTAVAYVLNATVVPTGPLGFLTLRPCGQPQPVTSNLNSVDGRVKAVEAIVPAGVNGGVCVFPSSDTHLVLDISGYFVPATDPNGLAFYPMAPCRVADTRGNGFTGAFGPPSLVGGGTRTFPIRSSSCSVPAAAQAYSLNYTAVPPGVLGYLTTWPAGQTQPLVSTLNAPTGTVTANGAIVTAGSNGDVAVFVSNNSDLVIDINGYFAPPGAGGLSLIPLTPCRALDTRNAPGSATQLDPQGPASSSPISGTLAVNITASGCGAPTSAQAYVLNATVIPPGILGFLTLWPDGTPQPLVSTLNANDGAVTSNLAIVPTNNGSIDAFVSNPTHLVLDIFGYFAP